MKAIGLLVWGVYAGKILRELKFCFPVLIFNFQYQFYKLKRADFVVDIDQSNCR